MKSFYLVVNQGLMFSESEDTFIGIVEYYNLINWLIHSSLFVRTKIMTSMISFLLCSNKLADSEDDNHTSFKIVILRCDSYFYDLLEKYIIELDIEEILILNPTNEKINKKIDEPLTICILVKKNKYINNFVYYATDNDDIVIFKFFNLDKNLLTIGVDCNKNSDQVINTLIEHQSDSICLLLDSDEKYSNYQNMHVYYTKLLDGNKRFIYSSTKEFKYETGIMELNHVTKRYEHIKFTKQNF